jgi:hypothetical protein
MPDEPKLAGPGLSETRYFCTPSARVLSGWRVIRLYFHGDRPDSKNQFLKESVGHGPHSEMSGPLEYYKFLMGSFDLIEVFFRE